MNRLFTENVIKNLKTSISSRDRGFLGDSRILDHRFFSSKTRISLFSTLMRVSINLFLFFQFGM